MRRLPPEDVIVGRLQALFATRRRDVLVGIGDDAAVLAAGRRIVASTDVLVEGQDFRKDADPRRLGRKAMNVNLSDLAAMGASPLWALLALGLPRRTDPAWLDAFAEGVREAAQEHGVAVVGGDLTASPHLFAAVTALGRAPEKRPLRRDGARAGDALYVSGTLGSAAAGFLLLEAGYRLSADKTIRAPGRKRLVLSRSKEIARLIRHQIDPRPMVELGRVLAKERAVSSVIDLSDGLSRDLHRLCRASGVSATLEVSRLPVDSGLTELRTLVLLDPLRLALFGGEDYGLLFTVPRRKKALADRLSARFPIRPIGVVDDRHDPGTVWLRTPAGERRLPDAGWDHFGR
ncbi:MAG: thiamine-phosphate kinase [Acidithiobacillales bacterium]